MKRIAVFTTASIRTSPEGTYTPALTDLIAGLSQDFDITVFTVIPPTGEADLYFCGKAVVQSIRARHDSRVASRIARFIETFRAEHRKRRFDLVHGFWAIPSGVAAVAAGRLFGIPSVVSLLGGEAASIPAIHYGNMRRLSTRLITRWTCNAASRLTALTRYQYNAMLAHRLNRDAAIIPFGPAEKFFCDRRQEIPAPPFQFLHVGDLNAVKDQQTLLRAFQRIASHVPCHLVMAGRDLTGGGMQRLACDLGIADAVTFLGHVHHDKLPPLFASADILLHSSRYEAEGVVIAEACAAGTVICATRVGLVADLGDACAAASEPGDFEGLAANALRLIRDPERFFALRRAARRWALCHDAAWTSREFAHLYAQSVELLI